MVELDRSITNEIVEIKEKDDTLLEIDTFWLTQHSYFASVIAFDIQ